MIIRATRVVQGRSIGVIGGGIGGLTTANALLNKKEELNLDRVVIYERSDNFLPTAGAGFGFSPNGQICLSSLGLHNDYQSKDKTMLHPFYKMVRLNPDGISIHQESDIFRKLHDRLGFTVAGCLRADLVDLLVSKLPTNNTIQYSTRLIDIQNNHGDNNKKVGLQLENTQSGETFHDEVDMVVGSDGINSTVARLLSIDHSPPSYSGANIFYGVIPDPDNVSFENKYVSEDNTVVNIAGHGEFITFRVGGQHNKKQVWACTYSSAHGPPQTAAALRNNNDNKDRNDQQITEEWEHGAMSDIREHLKLHPDRFPSHHPVHELVSLTSPDQLLHFGLFYRQHKKTWYQNRVVLLGDSCHATLPYVGQGANQAIEDAIVLTDLLVKQQQEQKTTTAATTDDYRKVFQKFYDKRTQRTQRVVKMANFLDKLYHSENFFVHKFLDFFLGQVLKGGFIYKQLENEIINECPVQDFEKYRTNKKGNTVK